MIDPDYFEKAHETLSLEQIAALSGATLDSAHGDRSIANVAPLDEAQDTDITFFENKKYLEAFKSSKAGACFVTPAMSAYAPPHIVCLITDMPYMAFAKTAQHFYPQEKGDGVINAAAHVSDQSEIGNNVSIAQGAVIAPGVVIGDGSIIGANTVIGKKTVIGRNCLIGPNVTITHCRMGDNVKIAPGVRIGQPGFGFAMSPSGFKDVPQLGRVIIHDGADIGANTTIDRGSLKDTVIGKGARIDNLVQLGHNVEIGNMCVIVSQTGISGSTKLGDFVVTGGQAGLAGHLNIASGVKIAAQSGIMRDIDEPGEYMGSPALPLKKFMRQVAMLKRMVTKKGD